VGGLVASMEMELGTVMMAPGGLVVADAAHDFGYEGLGILGFFRLVVTIGYCFVLTLIPILIGKNPFSHDKPPSAPPFVWEKYLVLSDITF